MILLNLFHIGHLKTMITVQWFTHVESIDSKLSRGMQITFGMPMFFEGSM
jgi:hypothetical protein